jgi:phospholipid/cholesterol/gamma-HCH transport system substrate-binding protein
VAQGPQLRAGAHRGDNDAVPILVGTTATIQGSFTGVSDIQLEGAVRGAPPITELGPEGVPVIPTKRGGLGEMLNSAPLLLERLATLTDRLTELLSDKNQKSIEGILRNTDKMTADHRRGDARRSKARCASCRTPARRPAPRLPSSSRWPPSCRHLLGDQNGDTLAKDLSGHAEVGQAPPPRT